MQKFKKFLTIRNRNRRVASMKTVRCDKNWVLLKKTEKLEKNCKFCLNKVKFEKCFNYSSWKPNCCLSSSVFKRDLMSFTFCLFSKPTLSVSNRSKNSTQIIIFLNFGKFYWFEGIEQTPPQKQMHKVIFEHPTSCTGAVHAYHCTKSDRNDCKTNGHKMIRE